jgi:hypothetical protein
MRTLTTLNISESWQIPHQKGEANPILQYRRKDGIMGENMPAPIRVMTSETCLLYAIIERAWKDLFVTEEKIQILSADWILSRDKTDWSFLWICEHLEIGSRIKETFIQCANKIKVGQKVAAL